MRTMLKENWGFISLLIVMYIIVGVAAMADVPSWTMMALGFIPGVIISVGVKEIFGYRMGFLTTLAVVIVTILFLGAAQVVGIVLAR